MMCVSREASYQYVISEKCKNPEVNIRFSGGNRKSDSIFNLWAGHFLHFGCFFPKSLKGPSPKAQLVMNLQVS